MGMDHDSFVNAFIKALKNKDVVHTLKEIICGDLEKQVLELKEIVTTKETQITSLEERVKSLESKIDDQEQYSRRNTLRINGINESEQENTTSVALGLFNKEMALDIQLTDVDRVHRIGKKDQDGKCRPILVKFTSYRARDAVFRAKSRLKKDQTRKIFINEDLTKARSTVFYKARQMRKAKQVADCWTFDGKILLKNQSRSYQVCHQ